MTRVLLENMRASDASRTHDARCHLIGGLTRSRPFRDDVSRQLVTLLNIKDAIGSMPAKCRHQTL